MAKVWARLQRGCLDRRDRGGTLVKENGCGGRKVPFEHSESRRSCGNPQTAGVISLFRQHGLMDIEPVDSLNPLSQGITWT